MTTKPLVMAYCVKCQQMIEMEDPEVVETKSGKLTYQGYCPFCGTSTSRFLPKGFRK